VPNSWSGLQGQKQGLGFLAIATYNMRAGGGCLQACCAVRVGSACGFDVFTERTVEGAAVGGEAAARAVAWQAVVRAVLAGAKVAAGSLQAGAEGNTLWSGWDLSSERHWLLGAGFWSGHRQSVVRQLWLARPPFQQHQPNTYSESAPGNSVSVS